MATDAIVLQQIAVAKTKLEEALSMSDDDTAANRALEAIGPILKAAMRAAANGV